EDQRVGRAEQVPVVDVERIVAPVLGEEIVEEPVERLVGGLVVAVEGLEVADDELASHRDRLYPGAQNYIRVIPPGYGPAHDRRGSPTPRDAVAQPGGRFQDLPSALQVPGDRPAPRAGHSTPGAGHDRSSGAAAPVRPAQPPTDTGAAVRPLPRGVDGVAHRRGVPAAVPDAGGRAEMGHRVVAAPGQLLRP